jgi:glycosyltransferase involved in cell wall biosynthesis
MNVSICVATYQRQVGLERLIRAIERLTFSGEPPALELVVADNDANGSARAVCDRLGNELAFPLMYVVEPRRGIPFARNACIAAVRSESDFVAFVDDDEVPAPNWLDELIRVQAATGADVVTGPVLSELPPDTPAWVRRGRFFERKRRGTATRLDRAFTGNVLIRAAVFHQPGPWFDERFALTGGSDRHYFARLHRDGRLIVWADDAIVYETVPPTRLSAKWLIQRFFRTGNVGCFVELDLAPSIRTVLLQIAKGMVWLFIGFLLMPTCLVRGRAALVRAAQFAAYGTGILARLVGLRYEEYRKTHGG